MEEDKARTRLKEWLIYGFDHCTPYDSDCMRDVHMTVPLRGGALFAYGTEADLDARAAEINIALEKKTKG